MKERMKKGKYLETREKKGLFCSQQIHEGVEEAKAAGRLKY